MVSQAVPIFEMLSQSELRRLATQLERVSFPDTGVEIISEGEVGQEMCALHTYCFLRGFAPSHT